MDYVESTGKTVADIAALATAGGTLYVLYRGARSALMLGSPRAASALLRSGGDPFRRIHDRFQKLADIIDNDMLVFIDNLDRCKPAYVVELLEGIQTIFYDVPVTYLVAANRDWVAHSFEKEYEDFTGVMKNPCRPLGYLFLERTFIASVPVPRPAAGSGGSEELLARSTSGRGRSAGRSR